MLVLQRRGIGDQTQYAYARAGNNLGFGGKVSSLLGF